jgi:hypothetical protein
VHLVMLAVMAGTMVAHSALASLTGAAVLVAASVLCAALSRSRVHLREHVLDLWAMALVLLVLLPRPDAAPASHAHAIAVPALAAFTAVVIAWAAARAWLAARRRPHAWRPAVASGALTGLGLAVMGAVCG